MNVMQNRIGSFATIAPPTHPWARGAYQLVACPRPRIREWALVRCQRHRDYWLDALAAPAVYPPRWTSSFRAYAWIMNKKHTAAKERM